jgi:N-acetylglutamate synthase-like GNAT family acetyltransferase
VNISYLADHPEFIETLASSIYAHWRPILSEETLDSRISKLKAHLSRDRFPIALVAHDRKNVYGTAALRMHDLPGREDISPWLGGLFVEQSFRGRGIGAALCSVIEELSKREFNISTLYLFTLDKQGWYQKLGWSLVESCLWLGREGDIMSKEVSV